MRLKVLLGTCALLLAAACATEVTAPSTSRAVHLRADGNGQFGSGAHADTASTPPQ